MIYKVKDLSDINTTSLKTNHSLKYIDYLDTANLNQGSIDSLQRLFFGHDDIPSRAKRIVKENDILYSTVRPNQLHYGFIRKPQKNLICSTGFVVLSPNEKIDGYYLYKYLTQKHVIEYLQGIAETSTSTYPSIKPSDIGELELELPPLLEQKAIANILSSFDDKIELNNKINQNLEELAQTLYKRWFVDFEFPNENGDPYQSSGGEMVESELGLIPKGWEVKNIIDIFDFKGGSQPPKSEHVYEKKDGFVRFIQNRDYKGDSKHLTYIKISKKNKIADKYDILMDKYGEVGKIRYGIEGAYNVALAKIDPYNNSDLEYLRAYFSQNNIRQYLENSSIASTRGSLNSTTFTGLRVAFPDSSTKTKFSKIQRNILEISLSNNIENQKLSELRDTLLPKLMSGEIEVPIEGNA
jgi:type I restriction enzyme S subunit